MYYNMKMGLGLKLKENIDKIIISDYYNRRRKISIQDYILI